MLQLRGMAERRTSLTIGNRGESYGRRAVIDHGGIKEPRDNKLPDWPCISYRVEDIL